MMGDLSNHFYVSLERIYVVLLLPLGIRDAFARAVAYLYSWDVPNLVLRDSWVLINEGGRCPA